MRFFSNHRNLPNGKRSKEGLLCSGFNSNLIVRLGLTRSYFGNGLAGRQAEGNRKAYFFSNFLPEFTGKLIAPEKTIEPREVAVEFVYGSFFEERNRLANHFAYEV